MANAVEPPFDAADWPRMGLLEGSATGKMPWPQSRWAWLVPAITIPLLIIAVLWTTSHVERDIEAAADEILTRNGIDTASLVIDANYRDVSVDGVLPVGVDRGQIERLLETEVGAEEDEDIRNVEVLAANAFPAALGAISVDATSDGESLRLAGTVPSQSDKDTLLAAVDATGLNILDGLSFSGLEPSSSDAAGQILRMNVILSELTAGSFTAAILSVGDDGPVTGSIDAMSAEAAERFSAVGGDGVSVLIPPELGSLDTEVTFDGTRIVLSGTVLSGAHAEALGNAAIGVVGAENVINNLEISDLAEAVPGADSRIEALSRALAAFSGLSSADATMNDTDLTVNGEALDDDGRAAAVAAVTAAEEAGLRPGGEINVTQVVGPDVSLQEEIDLLQADLNSLRDEIRENVVFGPDSTVLTPTAQTTLDKVVDAMNRYPGPVVEIGGHTDSDGPAIYNESLSQQRADAVRSYISQSISPERLLSVGFGESEPIADNTSEAGRRQNRRVELIAKESF